MRLTTRRGERSRDRPCRPGAVVKSTLHRLVERNSERGPYLHHMTRRRQVEKLSDLLVAGKPAMGSPQQFVAGRIIAEAPDPLVGDVQPPEQPAGPSEQDEEPHGFAQGEATNRAVREW